MCFLYFFYSCQSEFSSLDTSPTSCILIFSLFFFFCLHYIWNTTFPSQAPEHHLFPVLCSSQPPVVSLLALLPLLCFLTLPVLDFSPPFLLSLVFLLVLSLHPSCQAEWGAPLGRCLQTAVSLFGGLCQVRTPTQESFTSLTMLLAGVIPSLHSGLYAQFLCQKSGKWRCHIFGKHMLAFNELPLFFCFGGLCRNQKPQQQQIWESVKWSISK